MLKGRRLPFGKTPPKPAGGAGSNCGVRNVPDLQTFAGEVYGILRKYYPAETLHNNLDKYFSERHEPAVKARVISLFDAHFENLPLLKDKLRVTPHEQALVIRALLLPKLIGTEEFMGSFETPERAKKVLLTYRGLLRLWSQQANKYEGEHYRHLTHYINNIGGAFIGRVELAFRKRP